MAEQILRDFMMILATVDPVGTLSLFVAITAATPEAERRGIALRSVLYAGGVLVAFIAVGQIVLAGLGVSLVAFQLAGGIILFLFAIQMIFGEGSAAGGATPEPDHDVAVFPLAIPSIASPGAIMAVVLLTDNYRYSIPQQLLTTAVLAVVLSLTLGALWLANPIHRLIGNAGASILVRVMGLVLAALAVETVLAGVIQVAGGLPAA
jgi:multiple antibiotic resistance protein